MTPEQARAHLIAQQQNENPGTTYLTAAQTVSETYDTNALQDYADRSDPVEMYNLRGLAERVQGRGQPEIEAITEEHASELGLSRTQLLTRLGDPSVNIGLEHFTRQMRGDQSFDTYAERARYRGVVGFKADEEERRDHRIAWRDVSAVEDDVLRERREQLRQAVEDGAPLSNELQQYATVFGTENLEDALSGVVFSQTGIPMVWETEEEGEGDTAQSGEPAFEASEISVGQMLENPEIRALIELNSMHINGAAAYAQERFNMEKAALNADPETDWPGQWTRADEDTPEFQRALQAHQDAYNEILKEVARLKTVGVWTPQAFLPWDAMEIEPKYRSVTNPDGTVSEVFETFDPTFTAKPSGVPGFFSEAFSALKPRVEIVGVSAQSGDPVIRQQKGPEWVFDVADMPQSATVGILRNMWDAESREEHFDISADQTVAEQFAAFSAGIGSSVTQGLAERANFFEEAMKTDLAKKGMGEMAEAQTTPQLAIGLAKTAGPLLGGFAFSIMFPDAFAVAGLLKAPGKLRTLRYTIEGDAALTSLGANYAAILGEAEDAVSGLTDVNVREHLQAAEKLEAALETGHGVLAREVNRLTESILAEAAQENLLPALRAADRSALERGDLGMVGAHLARLTPGERTTKRIEAAKDIGAPAPDVHAASYSFDRQLRFLQQLAVAETEDELRQLVLAGRAQVRTQSNRTKIRDAIKTANKDKKLTGAQTDFINRLESTLELAEDTKGAATLLSDPHAWRAARQKELEALKLDAQHADRVQTGLDLITQQGLLIRKGVSEIETDDLKRAITLQATTARNAVRIHIEARTAALFNIQQKLRENGRRGLGSRVFVDVALSLRKGMPHPFAGAASRADIRGDNLKKLREWYIKNDPLNGSHKFIADLFRFRINSIKKNNQLVAKIRSQWRKNTTDADALREARHARPEDAGDKGAAMVRAYIAATKLSVEARVLARQLLESGLTPTREQALSQALAADRVARQWAKKNKSKASQWWVEEGFEILARLEDRPKDILMGDKPVHPKPDYGVDQNEWDAVNSILTQIPELDGFGLAIIGTAKEGPIFGLFNAKTEEVLRPPQPSTSPINALRQMVRERARIASDELSAEAGGGYEVLVRKISTADVKIRRGAPSRPDKDAPVLPLPTVGMFPEVPPRVLEPSALPPPKKGGRPSVPKVLTETEAVFQAMPDGRGLDAETLWNGVMSVSSKVGEGRDIRAHKVAGWLIDNGASNITRYFANKISGLIPKNTRMLFRTKPAEFIGGTPHNSIETILKNAAKDPSEEIFGLFSVSKDGPSQILIDATGVGGRHGVTEATLMHELLHSALAGIVRSPQSKQAKMLVEELKFLRRQVLDALEKSMDTEISPALTAALRSKTPSAKGLVDDPTSGVLELISWALTDPKSAETLKTIKVGALGLRGKVSNALQQFKRIVLKLFDIDVTDGTENALEQVLFLTESLIATAPEPQSVFSNRVLRSATEGDSGAVNEILEKLDVLFKSKDSKLQGVALAEQLFDVVPGVRERYNAFMYANGRLDILTIVGDDGRTMQQALEELFSELNQKYNAAVEPWDEAVKHPRTKDVFKWSIDPRGRVEEGYKLHPPYRIKVPFAQKEAEMRATGEISGPVWAIRVENVTASEAVKEILDDYDLNIHDWNEMTAWSEFSASGGHWISEAGKDYSWDDWADIEELINRLGYTPEAIAGIDRNLYHYRGYIDYDKDLDRVLKLIEDRTPSSLRPAEAWGGKGRRPPLATQLYGGEPTAQYLFDARNAFESITHPATSFIVPYRDGLKYGPGFKPTDLGPDRGAVLASKRVSPELAPVGRVRTRTMWSEDGRATLAAFQQTDFTSFLRELGHVLRRDLTDREMDTIVADIQLQYPTKFGKLEHENGQFSGVSTTAIAEVEDLFAERFVRHLADEGRAFNASDDAFGSLTYHLEDFVNQAKGIKLEMTPEAKGVYRGLVLEGVKRPPPGRLRHTQDIITKIVEVLDPLSGFRRRKKEPVTADTAASLLVRRARKAQIQIRKVKVNSAGEIDGPPGEMLKSPSEVIAVWGDSVKDSFLARRSAFAGRLARAWKDEAPAPNQVQHAVAFYKKGPDGKLTQVAPPRITGMPMPPKGAPKRSAITAQAAAELDEVIQNRRQEFDEKRMAVGAPLQATAGEDIIEEIRKDLAGSSALKKIARGTLVLFFGGDPHRASGLHFLPSVIRKAVLTGSRLIEHSIGETIRLLLDEDEAVLYRFLSGDLVSFKSGRQATSSGYNSIEVVSRDLRAWAGGFFKGDGGALRFEQAWEAIRAQTKSNKPDAVKSDDLLALRSQETQLGKDVHAIMSAIDGALQIGDTTSLPHFLKQTVRVFSHEVTADARPGQRVAALYSVLEEVLFHAGIRTRGTENLSAVTKAREAGSKINWASVAEQMFKGVKEVGGDHGSAYRSQIAVLMAANGNARRAVRTMSGLGVMIDETRKSAFIKFINGEALNAEEVVHAESVSHIFGLNRDFVSADGFLAGVGEGLSIPKAAQAKIFESLARAELPGQTWYGRQTLVDGLKGSVDDLGYLPQMFIRYMKKRMTRGAYALRQRYFFMNTVDHFYQMAATPGIGTVPALASTTRLMAQNILIMFPGIEILAFRFPDTTPIVGGIVGGKSFLDFFGGAERVRRLLQTVGDEIAQFFSQAKWRVEVNDVLRGSDETVVVAGRVYTYRQLRQLAIEEGIFSSFDTSELSSAILNQVTEIRRTTLQESTSKKAALARKPGEFIVAARDFQRNLSQNIDDIAEAWGERERIGAMVTIMEQGVPPRIAARLTIDALYDYAGTMSKLDRHWIISMLFPFWAFQKNANQQLMRRIFSPEGAYRMGALRRFQDYSAKAVETLLFGYAYDPYGVDVLNMPPEMREQYMYFRKIIEQGYGIPLESLPAARQQELRINLGIDHFNELTSEQRNQLENGYGGIENVPKSVLQGVRMAFTNPNLSKAFFDGSAYQLQGDWSDMQRDIFTDTKDEATGVTTREFVGDFVGPTPDPAGRAGFRRHRVGLAVPPRMSQSYRAHIRLSARLNRGASPYFEFLIPESTVYAGMNHVFNMFATTVELTWGLISAVPGGPAPDISAFAAAQESFTEVVDVTRAPIPALGLELVGVSKDGMPRRIHPLLVPLMERTFPGVDIWSSKKLTHITDNWDPDSPDANPETQALITDTAQLLGVTEDEARAILTAKEERFYTPTGLISFAFENAPILSEANRKLLTWPQQTEHDDPVEAAMGFVGGILQWIRFFSGAETSIVRRHAQATREETRPTTVDLIGVPSR